MDEVVEGRGIGEFTESGCVETASAAGERGCWVARVAVEDGRGRGCFPDKAIGDNGCYCALQGFERVQQLMRSGQSANEVAAAAQRFARMRVIGCA